jgi:hypothetical protein
VQEDPGLVQLAHEICAVLQYRSLQIAAPEKPSPQQLPKRLIQINHGSKTWKVVEVGKHELPYVAISYMWKDCPAALKCTKTTLHEYSIDQPLSVLPVLFGNAADYSARCGITHLWIDRFCIVQDDEVEMTGELTRMADIYANASFTIMSTSSTSDHSTLSLAKWHGSAQEIPGLSIQRLGHSNRTWVFQERLLSKQVLYGERKTCSHFVVGSKNSFITRISNRRLGAPDHRGESLLQSAQSILHDSLDGNKAEKDAVSKNTYEATLAAAEGIKHYEDGDLVRSAAKFVNARDSISVFQKSRTEVREKYLTYSTYLAIAWLGQKLPAEVVEVLDRAIAAYNVEVDFATELKPNIM